MTKTIMNRSRIVTILTTALVTALPATAQASSDIPGRGTLPDNRGYELVSPPDKNGSDVTADAGRVRASISGDAVNFSSLGAFGDAAGTGISTEYVSRRTGEQGTRGWSAHAITPRVNPLSVATIFHGKDTIYQGEFSDDLSKGVLQSYTPLTNDPGVANVTNLYLRQDVLSSGPGSYSLVSACPGCSGPLSDPLGFYSVKVAGATPDLGHVIFEATRNLTADAPAYAAFPASWCNDNPVAPFVGCGSRLYEWDHGTVRLVGVLPDGSPAPISQAGVGAGDNRYTPNTISDDGSRVFFTVPSNGGSDGDLYVRINHATTIKLNASQRTDCADHDPCTGAPEPDPAGPQPANYQTASADGTKVYFATSEQLTDDPGGPLYVYDTALPASDPHRLRHAYVDQQPDSSPASAGVLGTSHDGSYVYFLDSDNLLPGQATLPNLALYGIYLAHNGAVSFIGSIDIGLRNTTGNFWPGLTSRVSPDGRTLVFVATTGIGLGGYDHGNRCFITGQTGCAEIYRYRADTGTVTCLSCNPSGATATLDATSVVRADTGGAASSSHLNNPMTSDGNHVFFETGERLLPDVDINGQKRDVYEWTASGVDDCRPSAFGYAARSGGCLSLLTSGTSTDDSHFLDADRNGRNVFISTSQRLSGWDTDNNYDLYDVRVDGGLPEPPAADAECQGDGCQRLGGDVPAPAGSGSGSLSGAGVGATAPGRAAVVRVRALSAADRSRLVGGHRASLSVTVSAAGTVAVMGTARIGRASQRVLSASATATAVGQLAIPLALSRAALVWLRERHSLTVRLAIRVHGAPPRIISMSLKARTAKKGGRS